MQGHAPAITATTDLNLHLAARLLQPSALWIRESSTNAPRSAPYQEQTLYSER
ncbi:hypothetical protein M413DRAFT_442320 [Hebeloma cylindrosporum]|uniref:Uncharacterized protein n=1 Tax=Hebeloma cylindrosporum TaxID=76867 RepID=A0A0C3CPF8_HEBCY|nr:hypothetical protein M413DRAFT_442320 [Hebeloma cylindrosporum h7]